MKCKNCGIEFEPKTKRAQYCSDKCKVQANRKLRNGAVTEQLVTETYVTESVTETDQLFIEDAKKRKLDNWYKFSKLRESVGCWKCKKIFSTRLSLNRYCSPQCRDNN